MKIFHHKFIITAMLCSNTSLFCMLNNMLSIDHAITFNSIYKNNPDLPNAALGLKSLANNNPDWKKILDNESHIHDLFHFIGNVEKTELAAFLGTPGAIAFGKTFIKKNNLAQGILLKLLDSTAKLTKAESVWENQDIDVATNILNIMKINKYWLHSSPTLTIAADKGKIGFVKLLLGHNFSIECRDGNQCFTAVMAAANNSDDTMLDFLIEHGASVNTRTVSMTPLLLAINSGKIETVEKLIKAKADINAQNGDRLTPLTMAQKWITYLYEHETFDALLRIQKYEKIIQILLDAGATQ